MVRWGRVIESPHASGRARVMIMASSNFIGLEYFNLGVAFFILVSMGLLLGRLLGGPTLYDRLLALNSFGTKTVLFLCVFCFVIGRPDGVDIAILYALMNFIATIAVLKYFAYSALNVPLEARELDEVESTAPQSNQEERA